MIKANFYTHQKNNKVRCLLCPRECLIGPGQHGFCFTRKNIDGELYNLVHGFPDALNVDPVEKKPLFHFLPGSNTFSLGTIGCNLLCKNCQNWSLARSKVSVRQSIQLSPEDIVKSAIEYGCKSIAYTYNEPTVFAEYIMDIAELARMHGLKNIMVTNGYISPDAISNVYANIDAANIDLKAFNEQFYRKITAGHLSPVLNTIKILHKMNIWIELTYLLIPTLNDDTRQIKDMINWVKDNLGNNVPIHFNGFFPDYKLTDIPATEAEQLEKMRQFALNEGLHYVYNGNVLGQGNNSYCPQCKKIIITRGWHAISSYSIDDEKKCTYCGCKIDIR